MTRLLNVSVTLTKIYSPEFQALTKIMHIFCPKHLRGITARVYICTMKITNAINKVKKALGSEPVKKGMFYEWTLGRHYISFAQNGSYDEVTCIAVGRCNDRPDSMTDYFPEFFFPNIKQALDFIQRQK